MLPATTLAEICYLCMFEFTAITAIPRIMATTYATDSCKGMFDDMEEDSSIEITVTRANKNETTNGDAPSASDDDYDTAVEEKEVKVRKRTKAETEAVEKSKKNKKAKQAADTVVEEESDNQEVDLDEWPEDWEDEDENN